MRNIYLFIGLPGSGKSTTIDNLGLRPYALSLDTFREMMCDPFPTIEPHGVEDCTRHVSFNMEKNVWSMFLTAMDNRMKQGSTIVVDCMNVNHKSRKTITDKARVYGYHITYIIINPQLTKAELMRRNTMRAPEKRVPNEMYDTFMSDPDDTFTVKIKNDEQIDEVIHLNAESTDEIDKLRQHIWHERDEKKCIHNLDDYDHILVVGDIHSMDQGLKRVKHFAENLEGKTFFIFTGDLFDRGPNPHQVLNPIFVLTDNGNAEVVIGNHEVDLMNVVVNGPQKTTASATKKTFDQLTGKPGLKETRRRLRTLLAKAHSFYPFVVGGHKFICTHGGVTPSIIDRLYDDGDNLIDLPDWVLTMGSGSKTTMYRDAGDYNVHLGQFFNHDEITQFFGHRIINTTSPNTVCLESGVDRPDGLLSFAHIDNTGDEPTVTVHRIDPR